MRRRLGVADFCPVQMAEHRLLPLIAALAPERIIGPILRRAPRIIGITLDRAKRRAAKPAKAARVRFALVEKSMAEALAARRGS